MKMPISPTTFIFFFFNDTATTEIYTLSLHDALPISKVQDEPGRPISFEETGTVATQIPGVGVTAHSSNGGYQDRKSTRLNSSHLVISYAVFCLKKKKKSNYTHTYRQQVPSYSILCTR